MRVHFHRGDNLRTINFASWFVPFDPTMSVSSMPTSMGLFTGLFRGLGCSGGEEHRAAQQTRQQSADGVGERRLRQSKHQRSTARVLQADSL